MDYYGAPHTVHRSYDGAYSNSHSRFAMPGWILLIIGFLCLVLGFVDIGWTATNYGSSCSYQRTAFYDPCEADHIYTYISSPIWGGLIIMGAGLVAVMMTPRRLMKNGGMLYYMFVGLCLLILFLVGPGIVVLNALELAMNDETFYNSDVGGSLGTSDNVKFALPIVLAILGALAFFVAITGAVIACCCRPPLANAYDNYGGDMMPYGRPTERVIISEDEARYEPRYESRYDDRPVRSVIVDEPVYREPRVVRRVVERPYRSYTDWDRDYGDYGSYRSFAEPASRYAYRPTARSVRAIRY